MLLGTRKQTAKIKCYRIALAVRSEIIEARNFDLLMDEQIRFENQMSGIVRYCFYRLKVYI